MAFPKIVAHFETTIVNKIDDSSSTMELASIATPAGNLGSGTYGFVIEEETTGKREYVIGTLSGSTVTFTKRDVSPLDATTEDASSDTSRQAHRKGSSVKVTNFPILLLIQRVLEGTDQLDASSPLEYDATASITNNNQLATKAYVDSVVNGGTLTIQDQVLTGDAGETVSAGQLLYLKTSDGEWYKVDADDTATLNNTLKGIAQGAGTDGNAISGGVLVQGLDTNTTYTAGQLYYASNTAGGLATSAGTNTYVVGVGDANNKLVFLPDQYYLTQDQKAGLTGISNAPTASNPFVTTDDLSDDSIKPPQVVVFTANGTWTKDANLKYVIVEVVGGGGAGGNAQAGASDFCSAGGGGAGGYSRKLILASALGSTETVTVGAGGTASGSAGGDGGSGGNTTFGAHITGNGGVGGTGDNNLSQGGSGGTASGGDINIDGGDGNGGCDDGGGAGDRSSAGGLGGASYFGGGGSGGEVDSSGNAGEAGQAYGSGGGGASSYDSSAVGGGAGKAGLVVVTEYYM